MPITMPEKKQSGLLGMVGKVAAVASGNPLAIAGAAVAGNTPLGKAISGYNSVSGAAKGIGDIGASAGKMFDGTAAPGSASPEGAVQKEDIGEDASSNPMQRRMEEDPAMLVHQGLEHVDNPDIPFDYETRMAILEPLLRAKHFGPGGGIS